MLKILELVHKTAGESISPLNSLFLLSGYFYSTWRSHKPNDSFLSTFFSFSEDTATYKEFLSWLIASALLLFCRASTGAQQVTTTLCLIRLPFVILTNRCSFVTEL